MAEIITGNKNRSVTLDIQGLSEKYPLWAREQNPSPDVVNDPTKYAIWLNTQSVLHVLAQLSLVKDVD
jgi:hypothetical protein